MTPCNSVQTRMSISDPQPNFGSGVLQIPAKLLEVTGVFDIFSGLNSFYHSKANATYSITSINSENSSWHCILRMNQGSKDWICNGSYQEALQSVVKNSNLRWQGAKQLTKGIGKAAMSLVAGYLLYCGFQQYSFMRAPQVCKEKFPLDSCERFFAKNQSAIPGNYKVFLQWKECADKYELSDCNQFLSSLPSKDSNIQKDFNELAFGFEAYKQFAQHKECLKEFAPNSSICELFADKRKGHLEWAQNTFSSWKQCRVDFKKSPEDCDQFIDRHSHGIDFGTAHDFVDPVSTSRFPNVYSRWKECAKTLGTATCNLFLGKGKWEGTGPVRYNKTGEIALSWSDQLYSRFLICHDKHSIEDCKQFLVRKSSFAYIIAQYLSAPLDLGWSSRVKSKWETCLKTNPVGVCNKFIVKPSEPTPWNVDGLDWNGSS